ncbi:MAG: hypothetical protein JO364_15870 [Pseudonocardiales bacterium]|nr:hypothetical protein [Pseudonocardiales bacterium]
MIRIIHSRSSRHSAAIPDSSAITSAPSLLNSYFHGPVTLADSIFDKSVDLRRTVFRGDLDLRCRLPCPVRPGTGRMTVNTTSEVFLPDGWTVLNDGRIGQPGGAATPP